MECVLQAPGRPRPLLRASRRLAYYVEQVAQNWICGPLSAQLECEYTYGPLPIYIFDMHLSISAYPQRCNFTMAGMDNLAAQQKSCCHSDASRCIHSGSVLFACRTMYHSYLISRVQVGAVISASSSATLPKTVADDEMRSAGKVGVEQVLGKWIAWALSLITNMVLTGLIAYQAW